jgi:hypothetical protein
MYYMLGIEKGIRILKEMPAILLSSIHVAPTPFSLQFALAIAKFIVPDRGIYSS